MRRTAVVVDDEYSDLLVYRPLAGEFATIITDCRLTMPEAFDPYSQWLGIRAPERPIDHYRMLGIARFTSDPSEIAAAADRRMALIRSYQTGPRGRLTQPLLNEIAAAKLCLLNPPAKTAYDAMLQGLESATEQPCLAAPPTRSPTPPSLPPPPPPPPRGAQTAIANAAEMSTGDDNDAIDAGLRLDGETGPWDAEDSGGTRLGTLVVGLALAVMIGVAAFVVWRVIDTRARRADVANPAFSDDHAPSTGNDNGTAWQPAVEPVVVFQETDGSVNFTPSVAVLRGASLRLENVGVTDLLTGWSSVDAAAAWKCKIVKLPPSGVFQVFVTYRASAAADQGSFQIALGSHEESCRVRGSGEFVTDEYYLAVTRTGEQTLELRSFQTRGGTFELKGLRFVLPTAADE